MRIRPMTAADAPLVADLTTQLGYPTSPEEAAQRLSALDGRHEVRVRWLPFRLNPAMPKEGISRREYRTRKFGSWERSLELELPLGVLAEPVADASPALRVEVDQLARQLAHGTPGLRLHRLPRLRAELRDRRHHA